MISGQWDQKKVQKVKPKHPCSLYIQVYPFYHRCNSTTYPSAYKVNKQKSIYLVKRMKYLKKPTFEEQLAPKNIIMTKPAQQIEFASLRWTSTGSRISNKADVKLTMAFPTKIKMGRWTMSLIWSMRLRTFLAYKQIYEYKFFKKFITTYLSNYTQIDTS